jgi:hypothetical protein
MKSYLLIPNESNNTYSVYTTEWNELGSTSDMLASNIPAQTIAQTIHRLLATQNESTLEGKNKAYGTD